MKKNKKIGIWMDHSTACWMEYNVDSFEVNTITMNSLSGRCGIAFINQFETCDFPYNYKNPTLKLFFTLYLSQVFCIHN
jgi:hypothetical protein